MSQRTLEFLPAAGVWSQDPEILRITLKCGISPPEVHPAAPPTQASPLSDEAAGGSER